MPSGTVQIETLQHVDIVAFAKALADGVSEDQALFFEEFFVELDALCGDKPRGTERQLAGIVSEMALHSRGVLEQMAKISDEAERPGIVP